MFTGEITILSLTYISCFLLNKFQISTGIAQYYISTQSLLPNEAILDGLSERKAQVMGFVFMDITNYLENVS